LLLTPATDPRLSSRKKRMRRGAGKTTISSLTPTKVSVEGSSNAKTAAQQDGKRPSLTTKARKRGHPKSQR